jgi:hypothetical protein
MPEDIKDLNALSAKAAYQLADVVKTPPQFESITPRWLCKLMEFKPLKTGIFRLNKVTEEHTPLDILCDRNGKESIPEGFVDYDANPREYILDSISTIININTRVSDIYNNPYDQNHEQIRLAVENIHERQESQLINDQDYGLLHNVADCQRLKTRSGAPTPDDLDELISKVWKEPSFFLAHPKAIAAFVRECTKRGVTPATVSLFGSPFMLWRGIPLVPTDKLLVDGQRNPQGQNGKTNILLVRTGEKKQGVIGLYQTGLQGEQAKGLSVRFMGIDNKGIGIYLISLYCSASVLANDALAVLEDVEIGNYYDYK